jgi:hypothetical protein
MSISGQSTLGKIVLYDDFCGPEIPVANAIAYGTSAGGCNYYLGPFRVTGDLAETDTGVVGNSKANGYITISGNNEDGKGVFVGTEVCFSPALNGAMVLEARVERAAITAGVVFVGFMATNADDVAEPITSTTVTCTRVCNAIGFLLDSQLTDSDQWHMPYMISTTATQTSTNIDASQAAVAAESDILKLELFADGSARWYINGKLEQSVGPAEGADVGTLLAGGVGCWGTTTTAATVDCDYLYIEANRDWTR